jgi:hypothetical protein
MCSCVEHLHARRRATGATCSASMCAATTIGPCAPVPRRGTRSLASWRARCCRVAPTSCRAAQSWPCPQVKHWCAGPPLSAGEALIPRWPPNAVPKKLFTHAASQIPDTRLHPNPLGAGKLEGEVHLKVLQQSSASIAAKSRHQAASPAAPAAISISSTSASSRAAGSSQQGVQPSSGTKVEASATAAPPKASCRCCGKL